MVSAHRQQEEKPNFKEITGRPWERFADRFDKHPDRSIVTSFAINHMAVEEFGRRLLEFRGRGERIVINEIGLGIDERSKTAKYILETSGRIGKIGSALLDIKRENVSFEPFELLNQIRNAGIRPGEFSLYAMDIRKDVLLAVKSAKVLRIPIHEETEEYLGKFFREFQAREGKSVSVKIPKEYRKRIICPEPFDIEKAYAPEKAHITFSFIYGGSLESQEAYLANLVKSTKTGGYVMFFDRADEKLLDELGLENAHPKAYWAQVYRLR